MSETDYSFEPEANDVLIEVDELVENPDIDIGEYDSSEEDSVTGSLGGLQFDVIDSDSPTVYTTIDDVTPADYTCGTPGELPTPSTALVDADLPLNKIITVVTTNVEQIVEVNEDLIQFISDNNARVYAVLNDGTRVQCELSDVFDPDKAHAQVFVNQGLIIANALKQHFWYDSNGAHVTDDEQDDWNEEYSKTGHGDLANPSLNRPWHNILINSYGLLIRKGLIWLSQHSIGSVLFYDGTGNTLNNVVAGFSTDGVQIGKLTEKHLIIDDDGFTAYDENGDIAPITAYLNGSYIEDSTITGGKIVDSSITGGKIDDATITGSKIARSTIENSNIKDGTITGGKIADAAITGAKIASSTIENSNIKDGTITGGKIVGSTLTDIPQAAIVNLSTDYAHVTNGIIDRATIDHANVNGLSANYAQVSMANVNNAWIENGTVKNGAIFDAMINSVSANKLTAGTIDASNITVTNLNADNITTGTINGQRIGTGSLSLDKLSDDVYTESEVDNLLAIMQSEIDGAIETWTGTAVPTLNNAPASGWSTNTDKDKHVGDVYFVVNSQSQQNGYNYRFTKSGNAYSWQLIKDTDITNALSRLSTAEGKITTFDSDITTLKTDTGTLKTKTQSLETSLGDKVDVTTFNDLEDTVDGHSQTISQHTTAISNKADNSTVTSVTNRVSKNEQDISGINTTISELSTTVESKADGSTVETVSNRLSTVSDTVNGHTSQLSSITNTQTSIQGSAVKSTVQLWFTKANTTAPNKPTAHITTDNASTANAWNLAVPTYNASYPNYFYCYEYEYLNGTYGWSAVTRDIATGEAQSTARTAASDASTAKTNAATAVSTANTANTNASNAVSTANTANTSASNAVSTANTAASDASTAKTNAATAVSTANTASTNASNAVTTANTAKSTADTAKATADKNVKETILLWYSKANSTAPSKPTSVVTSTSTSGNAWSVVVPTYSASYPYYFYCYQYKLADGTYTWSSVVYDQATTEAQSTARAASSSLATYITSNDAAIQSLQNQVDGQIEAWYYSVDPTTSNVPASDWTTDALKARHEGDLYYNVTNGHSWRWLKNGSTYSWQQIPDSDAAAALAAAQNAQNTANNKRRIFTATPTVPYDKGDLWVNGSVVKYATTARSNGNYTASDWSTTATDDTAANAAQATADKNVRESQQLWFTKANSTAPGKPTAKVTSTATTGNAWTTRVPTYNASYKYYFYCMQYIAADGTVTWSDVIYDQATTEAQSVARAASADLTEFHQEYATFKQTTQNFESTVGETYATKMEIAEAAKQYDSDTESPLVVGDNAATASLRSYEGTGHAEQFTTTGKNLLQNDGYFPISGTASNSYFREFNANTKGLPRIEVQAEVTYTLSFDVESSVTPFMISVGLGTGAYSTDIANSSISMQNGRNTITFTPTAETIQRRGNVFSFRAPRYGSTKEFTYSVSNVQLELGSTATDYEPYTGGAPSPSPDYPQEIKVVRGRNLWDGAASVTLSAAGHIVPITGFDATAGESYTLSFNASEFTPSQSTQVALYFRNSSNTELTHNTIAACIGINSITLVAPSGTAKIQVYANFACMVSNIQLELGSVATPYVPYGHVGLEAQGRNLMDVSKSVDGKVVVSTTGAEANSASFRHSDYIPVMVNTTYYMSYGLGFATMHSGAIYDVNKQYLRAISFPGADNQSGSFNTGEDAAYVILNYFIATHAKYVAPPQLELGSVAHDYEPYYHETRAIPLPQRGWVAKVPDSTADILTLDSSGKVTWELNDAEVVLDGSENGWRTNGTSGYYLSSNAGVISDCKYAITDQTPVMSNLYPNRTFTWTDSSFGIENRTIWVGDRNSTRFGSLDGFKAFLVSTNLIILYPLATPTIEDCGYIDMPQVSEGCTISIPELEDSGISWWCKASESMANVTTAIEKRVTTAETSITQTREQILLKANASDVYTKTQTDGLISTEVTNRNAAITAATNAITLSVSQTYATKTYVDDGLEDANDYTDTEVASAKAAIKVTTDNITTEVAKKTDKDSIISTIRQSAETVKIQASKLDITGEAVFNAINNDTGTTKINGGKIDATSITLGYSQITNTPSIPTKTSDLTNDSSYATTSQAQGYADAKDTAIAAAAKRTYVSIRATAVDYSANTATLEATLYIDGVATTTNVTYVWLMDGTVISGATSRTYSVPASNGLNHAYSCKCTATV